VSAFRYALDDPSLATPATQVMIPAGQTSVTVQVAPRHDWLNALYVYPVDRAGNVGRTPAVYGFYVKSGADPVGHWRLDDRTGTTAADSAATPHPLTLSGSFRWSAGRVAGDVNMDGTTAYGSTTGPVVRTDRSMTVAAWVLLTDKTKNHVVASQSGLHGSGFQLYYSAAHQRWIFGKYNADTTTEVIVRALSDADATTGIWTHLVGVYDHPHRQLRLYVNGVRQAAPLTYPYTAWNATGPLQLGRTKYRGQFIENFAGDIDELKIWDRELSDDPRTVNDPALGNEIAAMAKQPPVQRGGWKFDEGTGSTVANPVDARYPATLGGAATWSDDGFDGGGVLSLDGVTGHAATPLPPLRTDHSYAVTAWVRLAGDDTCVLPGRNLTAVSQIGSRNAAYYLGFRRFTENGVVVPRWSFSTINGDTDTSSMTHARSAEPIDCTALNTWTHLVGVYDEPAAQIRLYVNGQLVDQRPAATVWAAGVMQIGRAKYHGNLVDYFAGEVDDVHAYTGTLTDRQVINLAMNLPIDG
jgi:hypothetical protein